MQCVIICAGKGTRMYPLTEHTPKPLLLVCGKPILQHIVEALPSEIDELILVVGYLQEQIRAFCKDEFLGKKVTYVQQKNFSGGTGDALMCAKDVVRGKFLFMYADDIHGKEALKEAVQCDHAILGSHSDHPEDFGVMTQNEEGLLKQIVEKPKNPNSNTVYIGGCVLNPDIFKYNTTVSKEHGEIILTDTLTAYAQDHTVQVIMQDMWIPVGKPEHIFEAEAILCPHR